ncbi:uncharacterized protein BJ212DRAFT_1303476 [Suillus subaureus]|uniref:Uncharacterized protein n=1 Tax=Suillus subaureus TaxID=48587 RepID=A0A9P7J8A2_9AGAM|nr:uncharacterized protein BJ212DRAFT_1303476 [Suillus subaureus]KAG1807524.1 hypothetical protein BJ212DRAFT_1303476 [Suillus subaureus]
MVKAFLNLCPQSKAFLGWICWTCILRLDILNILILIQSILGLCISDATLSDCPIVSLEMPVPFHAYSDMLIVICEMVKIQTFLKCLSPPNRLDHKSPGHEIFKLYSMHLAGYLQSTMSDYKLLTHYTKDAYAKEDQICDHPSCMANIRTGEPCFYVATIEPGQCGRYVVKPYNCKAVPLLIHVPYNNQ